jgi:hypothetical protein
LVLKNLCVRIRVARWFIFKPKKLIWVNLGEPWNGKYWYTYLITIWNILLPFGMINARLV